MPETAALPCIRCGYDLRGLPQDGLCPECANPCIESFLSQLDDATRLYLRRLARACFLIAASFACILLLNLLPWAIFGLRRIGTTAVAYSFLAVTGFGFIASVGLWIYGWWQASRTPPPRWSFPGTGYQSGLRTQLILMSLCAALVLSSILWRATQSTTPAAAVTVVWVAGSFGLILLPLLIAIVGFLLLESHTRERIHDPALARWCRRTWQAFLFAPASILFLFFFPPGMYLVFLAVIINGAACSTAVALRIRRRLNHGT